MANPASTSELIVPKRLREVIGAIILTAFILFFLCLAGYNLVIIVSVGFCKEKGTKRFLTDVLGACALKQFARTIRRDSDQNEIQFGYQMFGYRLSYFTIPVDNIVSVNWSTGQATSMAGRDVNDWSVALWFEHGDPVKSQKQHGEHNPDQNVYIVGPMGRKEETVAFGHSLTNFLRNSGGLLVQGENEGTFVRQTTAA